MTKYFIEKILSDYERAYGLKFVSLRYFNAAGADPEGRLGEMHEPETHLIPNILLFLLRKKENFELFGTDFSTPDGTAVRDYIHVEDLAAAHLKALDYLRAGGESTTLNCGYGHGYSVREVLEMVEKVNGRPLNIEEAPRRAGDPPTLIAGADRIRSELDWEPRYDDLEAIVRSSLNWERKLAQG